MQLLHHGSMLELSPFLEGFERCIFVEELLRIIMDDLIEAASKLTRHIKCPISDLLEQ